jgi:hypothetical protein
MYPSSTSQIRLPHPVKTKIELSLKKVYSAKTKKELKTKLRKNKIMQSSSKGHN